MMSVAVSGLLFAVLTGTLNASCGFAKYGSVVSGHIATQAEKRPAEEALLNFRIEEVVEGVSLSSCAVGQKADRDQRLLDPQLPPSDKWSNVDPATSDQCQETDLRQQGKGIPISIKHEKRSESLKTPSQSLRHASLLLHRAASAIENNNVLAVQLIRGVISILKHQVIPSLLDEQHSVLLPTGSLTGLAEQEMDCKEPITPAGESPLRRELSSSNERGEGRF